MIRILLGISLINLAVDYPLPIAILLISYIFTTNSEKEKIIKVYKNLKNRIIVNKVNLGVIETKDSIITEKELEYYNKN